MKTVLAVMLLFLGSGTFAQELTVDPDNFNEVEISNGLSVTLSRSDENRVRITGSSREKVRVNVDNGTLFLGLNGYRLSNGDDTEVVVFYTRIDKITANQGSDIQFSEELKQEEIEFFVQQGSDLNVRLDVDNFYTRITTSANVIASGKAENQKIQVFSEGNFQGENLIGETLDIEVNNNGIATVYANKKIKATANAGGTILIYSEPENIEEKTSFGGSIKKLN